MIWEAKLSLENNTKRQMIMYLIGLIDVKLIQMFAFKYYLHASKLYIEDVYL